MSPSVKYLLARVGLFLVIGVVLWPTGLNPLVIAMAALLGAFLLSTLLLRKWRDAALSDVDDKLTRRRAERAKLRAALAGDDEDAE